MGRFPGFPGRRVCLCCAPTQRLKTQHLETGTYGRPLDDSRPKSTLKVSLRFVYLTQPKITWTKFRLGSLHYCGLCILLQAPHDTRYDDATIPPALHFYTKTRTSGGVLLLLSLLAAGWCGTVRVVGIFLGLWWRSYFRTCACDFVCFCFIHNSSRGGRRHHVAC